MSEEIDSDSVPVTEGEETEEEGAKNATQTSAKKGRKASKKATKSPKAKATGEIKKKKKSPVTHPRTLDMVIECLKALGDENGSSVQSIRTWILANFETVRPDMIKVMMRKGLQQGLDEGLLSRPKGQGEIQILSGRYKIAAGTAVTESSRRSQKTKSKILVTKVESPKSKAKPKPKAKATLATKKKAKSPKKKAVSKKKSPKVSAAKKKKRGRK